MIIAATVDFLRPMWIVKAAYLPFVVVFGAIVGSFLNVVILRVPARQNIISPPSSCPICHTRLRWYENLPIIGWLRLRGRCAHCGTPISMQYPLIEALCAFMFGFVFFVSYIVNPDGSWLGQLVPEYIGRGSNDGGTWPLVALWLILLSSLLAMTIIDIRTYTIPIELTWAVTIPALAVHAFMPIWPGGQLRLPLSSLSPFVDGVDYGRWTIPLASPNVLAACIGGAIGLAISSVLLRRNVLRHSFLDFDMYVGSNDSIIDYPHPRRELEWELDYLAPIVLGMMIGWHLAAGAGWQDIPLWAQSLGGAMTGYFVGAGLIWVFRLFGTLAFGKEAMGLGDAHLLACVGAVCGWVDAVMIFFLAPFLAIAMMLVVWVLSRFLKGFERYIPYGPWLALATVVVLFGDRFVEGLLGFILKLPVNLP